MRLRQYFSKSSSSSSERSQPQNNYGSKYGIRHVQCFMAFLAVTISLGLRVNLSVAIVSMTSKTDSNVESPASLWTESMQAAVLSSFFWGYQFLQISGGQMAEKFGPTILLVACVFICGVLTVLTPILALGGFYWMIVARILQGLIQGPIFPAINVLLSRWAPLPERGRLLNFVYSGDRLGMFVTMAISGELADSRWGWPSIFYVTGGAAILWALCFWYLGADSPRLHKSISESEKDYILSSISDTSSERKAMKTPWKAICRSRPMWALLITHCGYDWAYAVIITLIPSYFSSAFRSNVKDGGLLSSLPYIASYVVGFLFAAVNDMILNSQRKVSKTVARKFWNTIANWGGALGLCVFAFAGENLTLAMSSLVATVIMNSAINLGLLSNHLDLSPNFAGTLLGITNGAGNVCSIVGVLITGLIVKDPTSLVQWKIVFLTTAAVFFVGNLTFLMYGTAKMQPWNDPPKEEKLTPSLQSEAQSNGTTPQKTETSPHVVEQTDQRGQSEEISTQSIISRRYSIV